MFDYSLLQSYSKIYVGFSGGLDSTVLLHLLAQKREQLPPVQAIHIHHGISPNAADWQLHCEKFCTEMNIPLIIRKVVFDSSRNLEEMARKARYGVFREYIGPNEVVLTAHHADDQAETLLLQLFRGAGIDGLAAMQWATPFSAGMLIRPLLTVSRKTLEIYALQNGLSWVQDESNLDNTYTRNAMRNTVIPLLQTNWPSIVETLNRTSRLAKDARICLDDLAIMDIKDAFSPGQLSLHAVQTLSRERVLNCLRFWLKQQDVKLRSAAILESIYTDVMHAKVDAIPKVCWSNYTVRRYAETLYLDTNNASEKPAIIPWPDFPQLLQPGYDLGTFHGQGKANHVEIRFRQGGERFIWHGQTKSLKKLFQEWKIPPWKRDDIPLVYVEGRLAVVVGYAVGDGFNGIEVCSSTG